MGTDRELRIGEAVRSGGGTSTEEVNVGSMTLRHSDGVISTGPFRLTATGLEIDGDPTFETWHQVGEFLHNAAGRVQWWIGDWLKYGEAKWGDKYTEAMEATGLGYGTLANAKSLATAFEVSRRREKLSFDHHAAVASLPEGTADKILDRAEAENLTTKDVRLLAREAKSTQKPEPAYSLDYEFTVIRKWLIARRDSWPEEYREHFAGFIGRIMETLDVDDRGQGEDTPDTVDSAA